MLAEHHEAPLPEAVRVGHGALADAIPLPVARRTTAASAWRIWLPIPLLFLLLDVTFNLYFWRIPKLTGKSADYGYQFLVDLHRLHQPPPPATARVLAVGSSVSGSFDQFQIQRLLATQHPELPADVHRLLLPGIKPSDYRLFFDTELDEIRPDVVVLMFNLVDFLNPSFERGLKQQVRYVLPPLATLRERAEYLSTASDKLDLVFAGSSNLYRYRKLVRSSLQDHAKVFTHWLHDPSPRGGYGGYSDGYMRQRFGVPLAADAADRFDYYVHPEWLRQRGGVTLRFTLDGQAVAERVEAEAGWKTLSLTPTGRGPHLLEVVADSTWNPRAGGLNNDVRLLSVRLRQAPPTSATTPMGPWRYPPVDEREPDDFLRVGGATGPEFVARWEDSLRGHGDFAHRFRRYRDAKLAVRDEIFAPTGEYAAIEHLVRGFSAHGAAVVLVNSPESPLILREYESSAYYRDYLAFFTRLAAEVPHVTFRDLSNALPVEDFNDWHHVNFIGTIRVAPTYVESVAAALADEWRRRS
ncbi:MAG: hypothetical protein HYR72_04975 [Deltaproteobacteria bacterium]|nr:hypothetical protein [Deltaproteobacteria bacterium]